MNRSNEESGRAPAHAAADLQAEVDSPTWQAARTQMADLRARMGDGELSDETANGLARLWSVSVRTVWRRVHAFRRDNSVRAFLSRRRGPSAGVSRLVPVAEEIVTQAARDWWRKTENATIAEIYPTVVGECKARATAAPSRATVARRIANLRSDPSNFAGEVAATLRERTRLVKHSYVVERALAVVQIDHTVADVFIVDPVSRDCIGRPTLTVAIDVATPSVMGICLGLEAPSALLVALCLEHSVFPKDLWLANIGAAVEWPMHGQPSALHTDNGREFHSAGFRRGCDLNGIDTIYRPPGTPRFGGHIERLIGTLMRRVRLLPGNTFSDLLRAPPSRAEARAALTLADLGGFLVEDIARYHAKSHRALGMSPRQAWHRAWAKSPVTPKVPENPARFRCDFLPLRRRVVGREGIELFNLKYSAECLATEVALGKLRVVRFDPRDISRVYLEHEGRHPMVVPLRDASLPPMSMWEWNALRRQRPSLSQLPDAEIVRKELMAPESTAGTAPKRSLRARRRAARAAAWREVQAIAELPAPDTTMEPTLTSTDNSGSFAWEVLE